MRIHKQEDYVTIQIPRKISARAHAKLQEFLSELFLVEQAPYQDSRAQDPQMLAQRFVQLLREREPRLLKYLRALSDAGESGLTLHGIGAAVGVDRQKLGGVSSAVTRIWQKLSARKEPIVVKEYDRHYVRTDMAKALRKAFGES